jgi:hypothetical protein
MKQVQLVLEAYTPEKYEMGLLEYNYWTKKINVFMGFLDDNDKKLYVGEFPNRSIVKPCLISPDDKFEEGDKIYHIRTMHILRYDKSLPPSVYPEDAIHEPEYIYQRDYRKVIATPEEIGWFVTENLRDSRTEKMVEYMQTILDNAGKCFIRMERNIIPERKSEREIYSGVIEHIRKELEKPLLLDKKVIIHLSEETL